MLTLPSIFAVTVLDENTGISVGAKALVTVRLFVGGQPYYGDSMGLTDESGRVVLRRDQLVGHFLEDQKASPMDLRIPLVDCDAVIEINVLGGKEFLARQAQIAAAGRWIRQDVRTVYEEAENARFQTTAVQVDLTKCNEGVADIVVRLRGRSDLADPHR